MYEGMERLNEIVSTWLVVFDYVEPDIVQTSPTEVIPNVLEMNIKRLKASYKSSSSNTNSNIGQQFSMLLQEDKK
jgi:hypothetical protein